MYFFNKAKQTTENFFKHHTKASIEFLYQRNEATAKFFEPSHKAVLKFFNSLIPVTKTSDTKMESQSKFIQETFIGTSGVGDIGSSESSTTVSSIYELKNENTKPITALICLSATSSETKVSSSNSNSKELTRCKHSFLFELYYKYDRVALYNREGGVAFIEHYKEYHEYQEVDIPPNEKKMNIYKQKFPHNPENYVDRSSQKLEEHSNSMDDSSIMYFKQNYPSLNCSIVTINNRGESTSTSEFSTYSMYLGNVGNYTEAIINEPVENFNKKIDNVKYTPHSDNQTTKVRRVQPANKRDSLVSKQKRLTKSEKLKKFCRKVFNKHCKNEHIAKDLKLLHRKCQRFH